MGGGYHDGSLLANRLGLQFVRIAAMNTAFRTRKRTVDAELKPYVDAFERDGMLLIEDFLPADLFAAVTEGVEAAYASGIFRSDEEDDVLVETLNVTKHRERVPALWEQLTGIDRLNRLGAAVARLPGIETLQIDVNYMGKRPEAPPPEKLRGNNLLHSDVHYPSPKAWLYLNEIDEGNGALVYAKGSHKLTPARLAYDYDVSKRIAKAKEEDTLYKFEPVCQTRFPTPKQWRAMGLEETIASGKPNTIVFADVMGFHRRGEFDETGRRREQILFRFGDRPARRKTAH
jgi:Phytanoyl-CoA dioxygenase (PhyH)